MDGGGEPQEHRGPQMVTAGPWKDWLKWDHDAFETHAGPFHYRVEADGRVRCAMRAEKQHMNGGGAMHGGAMLTFADFCLFALTETHPARGPAVTVSLNGEFLGPGFSGELIEGTGEVTQAGKSLIFVRGLLTAAGRPMLNFSGVIKKVRPRARPE